MHILKSEFTNVLIGLEHDSAIQSWYIWIFCPLSFQSVTTWKDWTNLCLNTSRLCAKCIHHETSNHETKFKTGKTFLVYMHSRTLSLVFCVINLDIWCSLGPMVICLLCNEILIIAGFTSAHNHEFGKSPSCYK